MEEILLDILWFQGILFWRYLAMTAG